MCNITRFLRLYFINIAPLDLSISQPASNIRNWSNSKITFYDTPQPEYRSTLDSIERNVSGPLESNITPYTQFIIFIVFIIVHNLNNTINYILQLFIVLHYFIPLNAQLIRLMFATNTKHNKKSLGHRPQSKNTNSLVVLTLGEHDSIFRIGKYGGRLAAITFGLINFYF